MVVMLQRLLIFLVTLFWAGTIAFPSPVLAADATNASKLFEFHCSGCHINGGNIVRRGKNLKLKTLEKNGVATIPAIAALVTNGKGNMSAYRDRLTPEEIQQVSVYVLEQANQDWR
jgi:cytochrome c6